VVSNREEHPTVSNPREGNRDGQSLDDGVGIGSDWITSGVIR
jgi:hypothetical protein